MKKLKKLINIIETHWCEYHMGVMVDLIEYYNLEGKHEKAKKCCKQYDKYHKRLIKVMKGDE